MRQHGHGTAEAQAGASAGDAEQAEAAAQRTEPAGRDGEHPASAAHPQPHPHPQQHPQPQQQPTPTPRPSSGAGHEAGGDAVEGPTVHTSPPPGDTGSEAPTVRTAGPQRRSEQRVDPEGTTAAVRAPARDDGPPSWTSGDPEATQVLPRAAVPPVDGEARTEQIPLAPPTPPTPPRGPAEGRSGGRGKRRLLVLAAVVGALFLAYGADLLLSSGSVPRGVTVAGIPVGGMNMADAEQRLRSEIGSRTGGPIAVTVGEVSGEVDPTDAGLSVDWVTTLERVGAAPLNPITRIASFFTEREVGVVSTANPAALSQALEQLEPVVNTEPVEGSVQFEGTQPQSVDPQPGQQLDVVASAAVLQQEWANGAVVALPLVEVPPTTTAEDVAGVLEEVARPAVADPVTVVGEEQVRGTVTPEVIASALSFRAENGDLVPELNEQVVQDALAPQMAESEQPGRDATFDFSGSRAVVVPSQNGRGVDYAATIPELLDALTAPAPREITAVYADQPAEVTTEELEALGDPEIIGEFTTGGFAQDSGVNIRRAADLVDGTVVAPGETFSLDDATGPRTAANGYIPAGVIQDGRSAEGIAGGVSQVSTTLYNASYFAGMTLLEHQAHSFYISRYPAGREATIATGAIDNRFRNDNPTPVLIRTHWTPTSLTVQIYGQRQFEVTGEFGPRTDPTEPNTVRIPAGEDCNASNGKPGFTITDTRTLRDVNTGEVSTETYTTRYNPAPKVVCED